MPLSDARTHPPQQLDFSPRPVEKMFKFSGIFTKLKQLARCGFSGTDCNFALISTNSAVICVVRAKKQSKHPSPAKTSVFDPCTPSMRHERP